ncbi:DUF6352 family protein [Arenibaculum sp.]|jgi:hypothetical protein|uniref:DUF6352 family protein n=1 Tax=Arenibaculum sp. TaxID=2865862 RepID=UPI002E0F9D71|nr:DUF6352 family protein [Arenibaculum sp.]
MTVDFWRSSGFHLLGRGPGGRLEVTDDYLRAFLRRPELAPVEDSCAAERTLHASLMQAPRRPVGPSELAALADADARENYEVMLAFRDLLVAHGTLEACYLALFEGGRVAVPALFLDQMVHAVLRGLLDGVEDAFQLRAAELLFRPQRVSIGEGTVMVADEETLERYRTTGGFGALGRLVADAQTPLRQVELDVLTRERSGEYRARSDRFDMVLDISFTRPGLDALARVLERWVGHFLGVGVKIHPVQRIRDERWTWHVGLDVEASALLNDLYEGREAEEERMRRLLSLFRLEFDDPEDMLERVAGKPVYLALCMAADGKLRVKPQNLLLNLPVARAGRERP